MAERKTKKILALLLTAVLLLSSFPVTAHAVTQSEINALKEQRDELAAQREEKQAVIDQLEEEQAGVLERKEAMDERNMVTLQEIQSISEEIDLYNQMIEEKAQELQTALDRELQQLERYRSRVRAMEENGSYAFLDMLMSSSSLGELITTIDDIGEIMKSDRELEKEYITARENTERVKEEYVSTKIELEGQQQVLKDQQLQLELDIEEANQLIYQLTLDIEANSAELAEISAAEDAADARIARMVAQLQAQSAGGGGGGGGGSASGSGGFVWPAPSTTYCTSRFGTRVHPVTGQVKHHNGLDIGAGQGATVVAAAGGTVTMASVNGGYGNCIMIDHGNGYVTLYGHLSGYAVSAGDSVSQGQTIGYVGATGIVTGPHLHFEVHSGGGGIDPEQFFSGLSFSPDAGV